MEITINNQPKLFKEYSRISVQELLDFEFPNKQNGIALAINNNVVPKLEWSTRLISENDEILIIKATQGG